jgi:hypothetical protein
MSKIEKANLAELDWALANMDAATHGKKAPKTTNELVEADAKVKEDGINLKGLGALLFDDGLSSFLMRGVLLTIVPLEL